MSGAWKPSCQTHDDEPGQALSFIDKRKKKRVPGKKREGKSGKLNVTIKECFVTMMAENRKDGGRPEPT